MGLWTAHLKTLEGFYASDVYVAADNLLDAHKAAKDGVRAYVQKLEEEYDCLPGASALPWEDEWDQAKEDFLSRAFAEIEAKLSPAETDCIVDVRI